RRRVNAKLAAGHDGRSIVRAVVLRQMACATTLTSLALVAAACSAGRTNATVACESSGTLKIGSPAVPPPHTPLRFSARGEQRPAACGRPFERSVAFYFRGAAQIWCHFILVQPSGQA